MIRCECGDADCPVHPGGFYCTRDASDGQTLWRCDMHDRGGTLFCAGCAEDAANSGLFSDMSSERKEG